MTLTPPRFCCFLLTLQTHCTLVCHLMRLFCSHFGYFLPFLLQFLSYVPDTLKNNLWFNVTFAGNVIRKNNFTSEKSRGVSLCSHATHVWKIGNRYNLELGKLKTNKKNPTNVQFLSDKCPFLKLLILLTLFFSMRIILWLLYILRSLLSLVIAIARFLTWR